MDSFLRESESESESKSKSKSNSKLNKTEKKNNNLSEKQCYEFIELYEQAYKKKDFKYFINPKTQKVIPDIENIKLIYEKCLSKVHFNPVGNVNNSKVYQKMLSNITMDDLLNIIEDPLYNTNFISTITTKIFGNDIKSNIIKLKEYLNKTDNKNIRKYKTCISEIKKHIKSFDPFMGHERLKKNAKRDYDEEYDDGATDGYFFISRELKIIIRAPHVFLHEVLVYNSILNKNSTDFKNNLEDNFPKYYSILYMLELLKEFSIINDVMLTDSYKSFIHVLLNKNIIIKFGDDQSSSISLDKSISYSASPSGSTSRAVYHRGAKKESLSYIMNNEGYNGDINDYDFYTMEKWSEMPLQKLRYVIKIPYTIDGKKFCNAYYAKSLYKAWESSLKQKLNFINPTNRIEFTSEDKNAIMVKMVEMYPHIKKPKEISNLRKDLNLHFVPVNNHFDNMSGETFNTICIIILYKVKNTNPLLKEYAHVNLIEIFIPMKFIDDTENEIPENYSFFALQYKIEEMASLNKLLGKTIPFKFHKAIEKYNFKTLADKEDYIDFFSML